MFAVVEAGGKQLQVAPADVVRIERIQAEVGSEIALDKVLLLRTDEQTLIGRPTVEGAEVRAEVLGHDRGEKIRVFYFRRRKDSKKTRGHRQDYTALRIHSLVLDGEVLAEAAAEAPAAAELAPATEAAPAEATPAAAESAEAPETTREAQEAAAAEATPAPEPVRKAEEPAAEAPAREDASGSEEAGGEPESPQEEPEDKTD